MSDISPRRRLAGRAAIASAFLAVPLTASICYAEGTPGVLVAAAQAAEVDEWTEADVQELQQEQAEAEIEVEREFDEAQDEMREAEVELAEAERELRELERDLAEDRVTVRRQVTVNGKDWNELSAKERAELRAEMAELRQSLGERGELRETMRELRRDFAENGEVRREVRLAVAEATAEAANASAHAPRVIMECRDKENMITTETDAKGKMTMFVCEANADRLALSALRTARSAIVIERNLTDDQRREALREIDVEIERLQNES